VDDETSPLLDSLHQKKKVRLPGIVKMKKRKTAVVHTSTSQRRKKSRFVHLTKGKREKRNGVSGTPSAGGAKKKKREKENRERLRRGKGKSLSSTLRPVPRKKKGKSSKKKRERKEKKTFLVGKGGCPALTLPKKEREFSFYPSLRSQGKKERGIVGPAQLYKKGGKRSTVRFYLLYHEEERNFPSYSYRSKKERKERGGTPVLPS